MPEFLLEQLVDYVQDPKSRYVSRFTPEQRGATLDLLYHIVCWKLELLAEDD